MFLWTLQHTLSVGATTAMHGTARALPSTGPVKADRLQRFEGSRCFKVGNNLPKPNICMFMGARGVSLHYTG